ncbi:MAG: CBS domain-containing protein, partial [Actinobacteria bacterium]|nr:CBS domain-containing protein [Actinomycetota bacterium]
YEKSERLLALMGLKEASVLRELLGHPPDTAGGRMTPSFVSIHESATVAEAIAEVRAQAAGRAEIIYYAYVLSDDARLKGIISLRDLLKGHASRRVSDLMVTDLIAAHVADDQEEVARNMSRYNLLALPVVDDDHILRGIVTVDDIVDVFDEEASEDLSEIAGTYLGEGSSVTSHRLTGFGLSIVAGLVGAILLRQQRGILLTVAAGAWLLPIYLRSAQDLGTWSLARALGLSPLSPRVQLEALTQELLAAFASSAFLGLLVGLLGGVWTQRFAAAAFLGVGIFVGSLAASLIGLALPSMARALGLKRVLAHGRPLAVIVGLCSLLVYVWALASLATRI